MLIEIPRTTLEERINALFVNYIARDEQSGAYLNRSRGHSRGATSYYLVIPSRAKAGKNSLKIKAWTDKEAIEIANKKLAKYSAE